jgi:CspA family cold shock protein
VVGTVKRVVPERGFGFIVGEDGQEYFFHRTGLASSLRFEDVIANQRVSFEIQSSDKGPRASNVKAA